MSLLLVAALAAGAPLQQGSVHLQLSGASEAARANVLSSLTIAAAAERDTASPSRVRVLHERAEPEIRRALEPYGFYAPEIRSTLQFEADSSWTARYEVSAGRPVVVTAAAVSLAGPGQDAPALRRLLAEFPLAPGDTLRHEPYRQWKLAMHVSAADSGYIDAAFDSSAILVHRANHSAEIVVTFHTGPRYRFGPVTFNQDILDSALVAALTPDLEGEPYRAHRLIELQGELSGIAYFSRSYVRPLPGRASDLSVPVEVDLTPAPTTAYDAGGGYSTDTGPRLRARAEFRRLNRSGHRAEIDASASLLERRLAARYLVPLATANGAVVTASAEYASRDPATSESDLVVGGVRLARRRGPFLETLGLTAHHERFTIGGDESSASLLRAGASWELRRLRQRLMFTRGYRAEVSVIGSARGALSDAGLIQLRADGALARGIGSHTRVSARLELGRIFTSDFARLPPTLRFFGGGDWSVRGYEYQSLGARDREGNVIGGSALASAAVELDRRISGRWVVAAFYDVGGAGEPSALRLEQGAGIGIKYLTPVGAMRVYGAFAVSRPGTPFRIHVLFGPAL